MSEELLQRLIAGFGAGLGLFLTGGIGVLFRLRRPYVRLLAGVGTVLVGGMVTAVFVPLTVAATPIVIAVAAVLTINLLVLSNPPAPFRRVSIRFAIRLCNQQPSSWRLARQR